MWFDVVENIQIKVSCLIIGGLGLAVCTQITHAASSVAPHGYVMEIQMTPAACMMDSQRNKRRKCSITNIGYEYQYSLWNILFVDD